MPILRKYNNCFKDFVENSPINNKHYRPHHHKIQKRRHLFTCDYVTIELDKEDNSEELIIGVNKNKFYAHDDEMFDIWKDS